MHKSRGIKFASLLAIVVSGLAMSRALADEPLDHSSKLGDFLLAGMREQRELLKSGVFRFAGHKIKNNKAGDASGLVEGFCAFDESMRFFRIDWQEPDFLHDSTGRTLVGGKWVRAPEYCLAFMNGSEVVDTYPPNRTRPSWITPFDARALGLIDWHGFRKGELLESSLHASGFVPPLAVKEEGKGIYTLEWAINSPFRRRLLTINADQGFTPLRMEVFDLERASADEGFTVELMELTWLETGGTWVPNTLKASHCLAEGRREEIDLSLQWERVNQPTSPSYYTADGFDLKKGDVVVDGPPNKRTIIRRIGEESSSLENLPGQSNARRIGIAISLAAIVVLLTLIVFKRRRQALS